jgi:hypothetical protein
MKKADAGASAFFNGKKVAIHGAFFGRRLRFRRKKAWPDLFEKRAACPSA